MKLLPGHITALFPGCPRAAEIAAAMPQEGVELSDYAAMDQVTNDLWASHRLDGKEARQLWAKLLAGTRYAGVPGFSTVVLAAQEGLIKLPDLTPKTYTLVIDEVSGGPITLHFEVAETRPCKKGEWVYASRVHIADGLAGITLPILRLIRVEGADLTVHPPRPYVPQAGDVVTLLQEEFICSDGARIRRQKFDAHILVAEDGGYFSGWFPERFIEAAKAGVLRVVRNGQTIVDRGGVK